MIRLLQWLFLGHNHKWKVLRETTLTVNHGSGVQSQGLRYIQQCEHCGRVIKRDLA